MIFIPLILGTILRVYKIWDNYFFTGELGKEFLYTLKYIGSGTLPLTGMSTSHEWLNYGPIYYWILIPLMKNFGGSPFLLFWVSLSVSVIGILITYFVFKKIVDKKFALILTSFISVSPLWVWATRLSKLHTFFFILMPLTILFLYKIWSGYKKYVFWLGVVFGAILSFHFSQLPILIVILLMFYLKRTHLALKDYLLFLIGLIVPNLTLFIYDCKNGFEMIKNLVLWIPYRIAGFSGFYPKNNINEVGAVKTISSFNEFFGRNLFDDRMFWILGSVIFLLLFISFFVQKRKNISKDFLTFYVISSTVVQCVALIIHTDPPLHYFFPIFLNFGIIFSHFASEYWFRKTSKILTVTIFILIFIVGLVKIENEHASDIGYVPLVSQKMIAQDIVNDAGGSPFQIARVGPFDYFPENYAQNYKYLILMEGGSIDQNSNLLYTIIESGENVTFEKNVKN